MEFKTITDENKSNCENSGEVNNMATTTTKNNDDINDQSVDKKDNKDNDNNKLENSKTTTSSSSSSSSPILETTSNEELKKKCVNLKIVYSKTKLDINFPIDSTVGELKDHLENIISVPKSMQKVMIKGLARDEQILKNIGVVNNSKIMIVGSKLDDILAISVPSQQDLQDDAASTTKEELSKQQIHKKILDKGVPDDAMPGILSANDPLPEYPLSGMLNKRGGKVRLTFKLEQDQLWIGTKERTEKVSMTSIKGVISEPIAEKPQYHMMAIQLGPTEASQYWIYWVPAQYVSAIKDAILGKWGYF
ncbi:hypothetical protein HCN44_002226 [Aphidius gifuensis]|uniref:Ubiquitin-like domain-containing protein n=1 Tax=Aphidius gifuensis TaxID=684658 RepID=A0A834Y269_APHGI|nr:ubiquitin domain-containing protein UBFD1-like [Aphidius gifuensis]KAF7996580.1 hypothetical protein HCN44_002226 [Aphidius gifuensis]